MSSQHGSPEVLFVASVLLAAVVVCYWRIVAAVLAVAALAFTFIGVFTVVGALRN